MAIRKKCPQCGGTRVQLTNESSKHGCLWTVLFGIYYICYVLIKWSVGLCILVLFDWWMAIIKAACGKGYVWKSRRFFSNRRQLYYCHDCGYNFRA